MRCGATEAEEDGVARLHGDEGPKGIVDCRVHEAGDEAAGYEEEVGVRGSELGAEVDGCAVLEGRGRGWCRRLFG